MADVDVQLPDDPALLKQLVSELRAQLEAERRLSRQLQNQVDQLARKLFGRKSEKLNPDQLNLVFEEMLRLGLSEAPEESEESEESPESDEPPKRRRRGGGRRKLPENLPRRRVEHHPPDEELDCGCGRRKRCIGQRTSERLEYHPAWLEVIENVEYVYACQDCDASIVSGSKPTLPIAKGLAGPGLLAYVLVSKYGDHLPLYRLERIFKRLGLALSRKTLCDWVGACAELLRPIVEEMKRALLASRIIHTDDTSVPVLDPSLGQTRKGRLWVYIGDKNHPYIVYDYTPTRERDGPAAFLTGYSGYLQADAYGAYDGIYAGGDVHEVACWMHARRYFYEAGQSDTGVPFTALAFIKQLYQIEDKAKDLSSEKRYEFRQKHSVPVLDAFKRWLDESFETVLPKSPLAQAMGYSLRQWDALKRYTESGDLSIDNGEAERRLRLVALGRKNWLFTGSDRGGEWAADIYSIIETCKLHGVEPFAYLKDVLERLPSHPPDAVAELTPKAWAADRKQELEAAA